MRMRSLTALLVAILLCGGCTSVRTSGSSSSPSWTTTIHAVHDSLCLCITATDTKDQLSSLMQGLRVDIAEGPCTVLFPSAAMVRSKLKRHPNEVKATMRRDGSGREVRPDMLPLLQALSDTTAMVTSTSVSVPTHDFDLRMDTEHAVLTFVVTVPLAYVGKHSKYHVVLSSDPGALSTTREYTGRRLSREAGPVKNGLGEAPDGAGDRNRTIHVEQTVVLSKM